MDTFKLAFEKFIEKASEFNPEQDLVEAFRWRVVQDTAQHYRRLAATLGEDDILGGDTRRDVSGRDQEENFSSARLHSRPFCRGLRHRRF